MTAIATLPTDGLAITERHRPSSLDAIVGQGYVVEYLTDFLEAPHSGAFLFLGPTGTGKSSTARALAGELGCDLTEPELGGYRVIRGGEQTVDTIREAIRNLWARPMFSKDGWKVLAIEEGDRMSEAVCFLWQSALEDLPSKTVVIFTTNFPERFAEALYDRIEKLPFASDGEALAVEAERLIASIWEKETGSMDPPKLSDLPGVVNADGLISFRRAVAALGPLLRHRGLAPMPAAPARPDVIPVTTRVRSPRATSRPEPDAPTAPLALPAMPRSPKGENVPALAKHLDALRDLFVGLGERCLDVSDAIKQTEARLKAARKTRR